MTRAALTKQIRAIIAKYPDGVPIEPSDAAFLTTVLINHPGWSEKVNPGFQRLEVCTNKTAEWSSRGLLIVRTDGTSVPISWCVALSKSFSKTDASVAARTEVHDQITKFRSRHWAKYTKYSTCELCGKSVGVDGHVDHVNQFADLFRDFSASLGPIEIAKDGLVKTFASPDVSRAWREYHAKHAQLRLVHAKCNLKRSRARITTALDSEDIEIYRV